MSVKIIAGKFKGICIDVPRSARATLSRARQSLFDVLEALQIDRSVGEFFRDKVVLDCFAGSGAIGLEALSRGAEHAYFVDINKDATKTIQSNITKASAEKLSTVICSDILKLKRCQQKCDFVFLDPPFHADISIERVTEHLVAGGWISSTTIVAVESPTQLEKIDKFQMIVSRKIGTISFAVFSLAVLD